MRSLNEGEASALRILLAALPVTEKERIAASGLDPRTFARIRRRAYDAGWVFDRMVPNPSALGFETVYFVLAQPFAEEIERTVERWQGLPSTVLLWRWTDTLFGVFFSGESRARFLGSLGESRGSATPWVVASAAGSAIVPVYFDFEASWSRLTEGSGTSGYPHPLPSAPAPSAVSAERVASLVARPFQRPVSGSVLRISPFYFPRSQQTLLAQGVVERRTILDVRKVPPFRGRSIERIAFLRGELARPGTESELFHLLVSVRVMPFLFAGDGTKVLLGTLSPAPPGAMSEGERPNVLGSLQKLLREIQIQREPVADLRVILNHSYDRLFR